MEIDGFEIPDPTPLAIPSGVGRPESLSDTIRRMVRNEFSQVAHENGFDTLEEANDFECDDDEELTSPYEYNEMQDELPVNTEVSNADSDGGTEVDNAPDRSSDRGNAGSTAESGVDRDTSPDSDGVGTPPDRPAKHPVGDGAKARKRGK